MANSKADGMVEWLEKQMGEMVEAGATKEELKQIWANVAGKIDGGKGSNWRKETLQRLAKHFN